MCKFEQSEASSFPVVSSVALSLSDNTLTIVGSNFDFSDDYDPIVKF